MTYSFVSFFNSARLILFWFAKSTYPKPFPTEVCYVGTCWRAGVRVSDREPAHMHNVNMSGSCLQHVMIPHPCHASHAMPGNGM